MVEDGYTRIVLIGTDEQIKTTMEEYTKAGIDFKEVDRDCERG